MLQNVRDAGVVGRIGLEADGEDIVAVVPRNVQVLGSGPVMLQVQGRQLELGNMLRAQESKAMQLFSRLWEIGELGNSSSGSVSGGVSQHLDAGTAQTKIAVPMLCGDEVVITALA